MKSVRKKRKAFCREFLEVLGPINPRPREWSYTTSIEYMLASKKYMDSFLFDMEKVVEEVRNSPEERLKILDFGTGSGIAAFCLKALCRMEGIEKQLDIEGVDVCDNKTIQEEYQEQFYDAAQHQENIWKQLSDRYGIDLRHYSDISEFSKQEGKYDIIVMYAVYEHIPAEDLDKIMSVLRKALKSTGKIFIFKLPRKLAYMEYLTELLRLGSHEVKFGDREIKKRLAEQGFEVLDFYRSDLFPSFPPKIINFLHWPLFLAEKILEKTPLVFFSHNDNLIVQKNNF